MKQYPGGTLDFHAILIFFHLYSFIEPNCSNEKEIYSDICILFLQINEVHAFYFVRKVSKIIETTGISSVTCWIFNCNFKLQLYSVKDNKITL